MALWVLIYICIRYAGWAQPLLDHAGLQFYAALFEFSASMKMSGWGCQSKSRCEQRAEGSQITAPIWHVGRYIPNTVSSAPPSIDSMPSAAARCQR